jgi:hypothetical protein
LFELLGVLRSKHCVIRTKNDDFRQKHFIEAVKCYGFKKYRWRAARDVQRFTDKAAVVFQIKVKHMMSKIAQGATKAGRNVSAGLYRAPHKKDSVVDPLVKYPSGKRFLR